LFLHLGYLIRIKLSEFFKVGMVEALAFGCFGFTYFGIDEYLVEIGLVFAKGLPDDDLKNPV
jgi:hypothetical protein